MSNVLLKSFLVLPQVQEGIKLNLSPYQNEDSVIESNLYYSDDKKMYLVEVRLFNNDQMEGAYLGLFTDYMVEYKEYVDDVWSFTDWIVVLSN